MKANHLAQPSGRSWWVVILVRFVADVSGGPAAEVVSHRRRVRNELVRAVAAAPSLQDRDTWSLFLQELSITLGSGVLAAGQDTYTGRVIRVVNYCLRHADGMRSIAESIMLLDPAGTETDRILRWVDEWHVAELFSDIDIL